MRFAVSSAPKAIVIGVLGCAAAFLVACGDRNGLLPGDQASKLSSALDGVSAACQSGDIARAQSAAAKFNADIQQLRAATVDANLIRGLRQGAATLEQLVSDSCDTQTIRTQTTIETTPETTPTAPPPVTTSETPPPPQTTPETTPQTTPDNGGSTPPDTGGGAEPTTPDSGGGAPDTGADGGAPSDGTDPNQGNPGGAVAPGQGGTP
ncbi:hypothetical protein Q5424_26505 [Conexibacter sp. JD483]|uniref:hypothetical protein n=1 Tax=unclassified Conexibacter TaxID=2627773 RepID=UPI00271A6943|nr:MULTISPECIES: hypothetical protein [unclassified Conexibacter]MDO8188680.1 hypothetical protein [Conexibacter sp. CPCC 205706]MDO8201546.1 hypothetical protein [Conexibacter sp. CPCC 205762]MDR9372680.1 hypothetical protein [Conexibacter sp. JD483]